LSLQEKIKLLTTRNFINRVLSISKILLSVYLLTDLILR